MSNETKIETISEKQAVANAIYAKVDELNKLIIEKAIPLGIGINIGSNEYLELIQKSAIAVKDEMADESYAKRLQTIKILPVEIAYVVEGIHDSTSNEFEFMIYHRDVKFNSDHEGLNITHLKVIDCNK